MSRTRPRKTVEMNGLVLRVNRALTDMADYQDREMGLDTAQAYRKGMIAVLEDALHASHQYKGFMIADPKAERGPEGYLKEGTYDDSRRRYYL